jgi:hypothetical protein
MASWVVSNYYANYSYDENLRVFALKASEKVTNLSNELSRLSVFLQQELESTEYDSPREELLRRDARIEAAIHIINTLKSVNDKSLSDWQGVIGDEISAQREVQEEREEHLREILERVESLPKESSELRGDHESFDFTVGVRSELESIRKDIRMLATQVGVVPLRTPVVRPQRVNIENPCPACSRTVSYRQKPVEKGVKSVICKSCDTRLFSRYLNGEFVLQVRSPSLETLLCPGCKKHTTAPVDPVPGGHQLSACSLCGVTLRTSRTHSGISVILEPTPELADEPVDEDFLKKVQKALPPQPWPTGSSKLVAARLEVPHRKVAEAITELVRRGGLKLQMNGELYVPAPK